MIAEGDPLPDQGGDEILVIALGNAKLPGDLLDDLLGQLPKRRKGPLVGMACMACPCYFTASRDCTRRPARCICFRPTLTAQPPRAKLEERT